MQSSYKTGESVTFTWDSTSNTTHYNLWLARSIGNDKWENVEQVFYADNGMTRTFEAGEYRAQLLSYNSDLWETDHSDWVHTWSDDYFFTVEEPVLDSGTCGDNGSNVTWKLTEDGILTISGTGAMIDYGDDKSYRKTPWRDYFIESVRIDEGVTSIGGWAFKNCVLTSVMIPDSVTSIACGAFSGCRSLASVTIPEGLTSIDGYAFSECRSLASVTIPEGVTSIDGYAFSGCSGLTSVTIPNSVTSIGEDAFSGCDSLTSVTIPDSVTSIGDFAFRGCSGLTSVTIPSSVTSIGGGAFSGCTSLTSVAIPSSVTEIGGSAFSGCTGLTSVTIPDSVTSIDGYAFSGCSGLTDVYYAGTAADWAKISISEGNEDLTSAALRCAPASLPAPTVTGGNDAQGRPTLKWNAVSGAAKYEVYRARSKDGDYIKYSTVTGTSYTNTSYIEDGNTYYYKVRALDASGTAGAWSSIVSVTYRAASTGTLSAPAVTGGKDSQGRPTLKWNAVTGAAKYEVYRARSKDGDYIKYSTVTGTSYTNTSYIESGNTYYYKVRALDANGTAGAWSSIVSVTYKQTLSAPAVTGGNDAQGRPTLTWNAVSGAAKYEVYRARSKDGTYSKYSTTTGTAYTNSSYLTSGATYYYKVRALDANGNAGPYSAVVSVTCRLKLTAPTVTGGKDSQGRPTLKWNAVTGAAKYEVYRARSKDGDYIKYSTVTGTSYTNTSYIENGNTYYYKVRALGSDGTAGPDSIPVSVTYKAPFGAPLVTGSKDSQGRPALKWDKVTDAAKYEVYRARSKNGTYSLMSTQSATGYTNTSYLANGTTYYYKVRALKANGTASAYSSVVTITYGTVPTPAAPAMRSAKADSAGITVSWDTAANAVAYNVYRTADAGSSWTQVASSVKGTSYKDTTVQKGVKYGYKVRGVAADGKTLGPMSSTGVTAKVTAASTTPDYVKLKSAKSDPGNGILLTWESAADAKTYNVYRKVDGTSGWTLLASSVSGTSYRDTSGKRGTTYVYTVRGVAADGKTLSRTYNTDGLRATVR